MNRRRAGEREFILQCDDVFLEATGCFIHRLEIPIRMNENVSKIDSNSSMLFLLNGVNNS